MASTHAGTDPRGLPPPAASIAAYRAEVRQKSAARQGQPPSRAVTGRMQPDMCRPRPSKRREGAAADHARCDAL